MHISEMLEAVEQVSFVNYVFSVSSENDKLYLQANYLDRCIVTGTLEKQSTRKWLLSKHMTKSELIQTCFKCCITSMEHRTREEFKYKGRRIFGPHFDVDTLWAITTNSNMDVREKTNAAL